MAYFSVTNLSLSNQDIFDAKTIFLSNIEFTYHHILYSLTKKDLTAPAARAFVRILKVGVFFWGGGVEDSNLTVFKKLLKSGKNFPLLPKKGGCPLPLHLTWALPAAASIRGGWFAFACLNFIEFQNAFQASFLNSHKNKGVTVLFGHLSFFSAHLI